MSEHPLHNVSERLLRAGIVPRHVRRYISELSDHLDNLVARERATGLDPSESAAKARMILGSDAQLVKAMIDSGAPRSLAAKAPWMVFGFMPLITLAVVTWLLLNWSMVFFFPYRTFTAESLPENIRAIGLALTFFGNYVIGPVLAASCIVIALRQRLSSRWVWMGLALIALSSGMFGVHIYFFGPDDGMTGGIRGSSTLQVFENGQVNAAATQALMAVRAAVLFALSAFAYLLLKRRAILPLDAS